MENRIGFKQKTEQIQECYKEKIGNFCCDLYNILSEQEPEIGEPLMDFLSDYLFNDEGEYGKHQGMDHLG